MSLSDRVKAATTCPTCGKVIHAGRCPMDPQPAWVLRLPLNAKELAR